MGTSWGYFDHVSDARRVALACARSFDALVEQVVADATNIRVRVDPGRDKGLTDCVQPLFNLDLPSTGDALFNGPVGYRAQYWIGPAQGIAANVTLLAALLPKLLKSVDTNLDERLSRIDVCAALTATSAKIWIREGLLLTDGRADLNIDRWVKHARDGVELAKLGVMAPEISKFEVKGALIDPYGHEVVPAGKIRRHFQIHHYGFS